MQRYESMVECQQQNYRCSVMLTRRIGRTQSKACKKSGTTVFLPSSMFCTALSPAKSSLRSLGVQRREQDVLGHLELQTFIVILRNEVIDRGHLIEEEEEMHLSGPVVGNRQNRTHVHPLTGRHRHVVEGERDCIHIVHHRVEFGSLRTPISANHT